MNDEMRMNSPVEGVMGESLSRYTAKTFGWMFLGLLVTCVVAVAGYLTGAVFHVYSIPYWHYILLIAEVAVVMVLSAKLQTLSVGMARGLFFLYAALNGVVFRHYGPDWLFWKY